MFTEPAPYGYLYLGFRIDPPKRIPFVTGSARRREAIAEYKALAEQLAEEEEVVAATVYEAVLIPPLEDSPRFDVMILIQTKTTESIPALRDLKADFVMAARNLRRIGDTDRDRTGYFLFNHFTSDDPGRALRVWEPIAGWFTDKAGVRDSTLLQPVDASPYVFVNHVRLPCGPVRFFLRMLKPSFRKTVSRPLAANGVGNAPVACRTV